ncbi:SurA N-terminal domain-containing protein [Candidatus Woesearchaeota archaeon]|nr:SurA N-terminal domain-containing protein [Candidatus Woesearchaeota archaeon]
MRKTTNETADKEIELPRRKQGKGKRKISGKVITLVSLVVLLGIILFFAARTLTFGDKAIAKVNGEPIMEREFQQRYASLPTEYRALIPQEALLEDLIKVKLLLQEAKKQKIAVSDGEASESMQSFERSIAPLSLQEFLAQRKITEEALVQELRQQLILAKLLNATLLANITINDDRLQAYYQANKNEFIADPGEVQISHIIVKDKSTAETLLQRISGGENFGALAEEYSVDKASAAHNGRLGFITKDQLAEPLASAVFKLKEGEVSSVLESARGFQLIRREPDTMGFEDAKEFIRQKLLLDTMNGALQVYLAQLRGAADIEILTSFTAKEDKQAQAPKAYGGSFMETGKEACKSGGKPLVRLFTTTTCKGCSLAGEAFAKSVQQFSGKIEARHWQLNTGDNLLTQQAEKGIPQDEIAFFSAANPKKTVPFYDFGCKYSGAGNIFDTAGEQEQEITAAILTLVG